LRTVAGHAQAIWLMLHLAFGWGVDKALLESRPAPKRSGLRRSLLLIAVIAVSFAAWSTAQLSVSLVWTGAGDQFLLADLESCG
jgi:hypothetical protein